MTEGQGAGQSQMPATIDDDDDGGHFILGALVGAAVGVALGLLYAPRSGADTRAEIRTRSDDAVARGTAASDVARVRAADARTYVDERSHEAADAARQRWERDGEDMSADSGDAPADDGDQAAGDPDSAIGAI